MLTFATIAYLALCSIGGAAAAPNATNNGGRAFMLSSSLFEQAANQMHSSALDIHALPSWSHKTNWMDA